MKRETFDELCRIGAMHLRTPDGIDGYRLLQAIGGCESSFGANVVPRFEKVFGRGGKYFSVDLDKLYGDSAACSWGPWQIMYPNAARVMPELGKPWRLQDPIVALIASTRWLQMEIFGRQKAITIRQVFDAWNSGSHRDRFVPVQYVEKALKFYKEDS